MVFWTASACPERSRRVQLAHDRERTRVRQHHAVGGEHRGDPAREPARRSARARSTRPAPPAARREPPSPGRPSCARSAARVGSRSASGRTAAAPTPPRWRAIVAVQRAGRVRRRQRRPSVRSSVSRHSVRGASRSGARRRAKRTPSVSSCSPDAAPRAPAAIAAATAAGGPASPTSSSASSSSHGASPRDARVRTSCPSGRPGAAAVPRRPPDRAPRARGPCQRREAPRQRVRRPASPAPPRAPAAAPSCGASRRRAAASSSSRAPPAPRPPAPDACSPRCHADTGDRRGVAHGRHVQIGLHDRAARAPRPVAQRRRGGAEHGDDRHAARAGDVHRRAVVGDQEREPVDDRHQGRQIGPPGEHGARRRPRAARRPPRSRRSCGAPIRTTRAPRVAKRAQHRREAVRVPALGRPHRPRRETRSAARRPPGARRARGGRLRLHGQEQGRRAARAAERPHERQVALDVVAPPIAPDALVKEPRAAAVARTRSGAGCGPRPGPAPCAASDAATRPGRMPRVRRRRATRSSPRDAAIGTALVVDQHLVDVGVAVEQRRRLGTHQHRQPTRSLAAPAARVRSGVVSTTSPEKARLGHEQRRSRLRRHPLRLPAPGQCVPSIAPLRAECQSSGAHAPPLDHRPRPHGARGAVLRWASGAHAPSRSSTRRSPFSTCRPMRTACRRSRPGVRRASPGPSRW